MTVTAVSHPYATSHPLWSVDIGTADGRVIPAVVKETASRPPARPGFVHRPLRERDVYRQLLDGSKAPAPRLLGVAGAYIVLERLSAVPLTETVLESVAGRVGEAVRSMHDALAESVDAPFLLRYDATFYRRWLRRAQLRDQSLAALEDVYGAACGRLMCEPRVVIHGELYPSNVLVGEHAVWVVDWETAAAGPAVVDVAALVSGWPAASAAKLLETYGAVDPLALDCARLHLAVRWLGWSAGWSPPPEHARDWRLEAELAASRLRRNLG